MKTHVANRKARSRGLLMIEVIFYMGIFTLLLGLAIDSLCHCWDASAAFRRDAGRISQSLQAGECWRADVRRASAPIERKSVNGAETFRIPQPQGDVLYSFAHAELRRRPVAGGRESVILSNIKSSEMQCQTAPFGVVCRWELELTSKRRQQGVMRPLFTFDAVARAGKAP
jgi:hypothetical protein